MNRSITHHKRRAFTVPELLACVAIILIIISLLLPNLGKAREVARQAECMSNLHQAGIGFRSYATETRGYIPGPNTSVYKLRGVTPSNTESDRTEPITDDDWMSPALGRAMTLPAKKLDRLLDIFANKFRCPSNPHFYDYIYPNQGTLPAASTIPYSSYSAPFAMHYYWDYTHANSNGQPNGARFGNSYDMLVDIRPANHKFKTVTLGSQSMKVAATEGSRYIDSNGRISFNRDGGSAYGGNFMNRSPLLNVEYPNNGNPYKFSTYPNLHSDSARYAYRHLNESMNMVFFDGHAENKTSLDSRRAAYWVPSGSKVVSLNGIGDKSVKLNQIVE